VSQRSGAKDIRKGLPVAPGRIAEPEPTPTMTLGDSAMPQKKAPQFDNANAGNKKERHSPFDRLDFKSNIKLQDSKYNMKRCVEASFQKQIVDAEDYGSSSAHSEPVCGTEGDGEDSSFTNSDAEISDEQFDR